MKSLALIGLLMMAVTIAACDDSLDDLKQDIEDSLTPQQPFACGDALCETDEMCVQRQDALFSGTYQDTYTCEAVPDGCDTLFCECDATQTDTTYDGNDIIGCSTFGEYHLTLAVVPCGDDFCAAGEYCFIETVTGTETCKSMPDGCEKMCTPGCGGSGETFDSQTVQGCSSYSVTVGE